jgi:hypothetical protein
MSSDRFEQVEIHRPRRSGGDQRRPQSGFRGPRAGREPDDDSQGRPSGGPRPKRRSRARDWISR